MCSTNPVTYDEVTGSVDEDRAADIIYLDFDFSMLFDAVPLALRQPKRHGLDGWSTRLMKKVAGLTSSGQQ